MTDQPAHIAAPEGLQEVLRNLLRLAVVGDHVRWVLRGEGAADLVTWLAGAAPQWRAWAEILAEGMVELELVPDGRVKTLARDITRQWVAPGWLTTRDARNLLAPRLRELIEWTKGRRTPASANDVTRSLAEIELGLEVQLEALLKLGPE